MDQLVYKTNYWIVERSGSSTWPASIHHLRCFTVQTFRQFPITCLSYTLDKSAVTITVAGHFCVKFPKSGLNYIQWRSIPRVWCKRKWFCQVILMKDVLKRMTLCLKIIRNAFKRLIYLSQSNYVVFKNNENLSMNTDSVYFLIILRYKLIILRF